MAVITRQILNENFTLKTLSKDGNVETFNRNFIIHTVNKAKTYLIEEKNVQPGQKIVLINNAWPHYLIWFLAAAELGLSFVVSDYPRLGNSFSVKKKLSLYGSLDLVIGNSSQDIWDYFVSNEYQKVDLEKFWYSSSKYKDTFWATDESVLIYSTSSGSTGTPKVVEHTHDFFYKLLERNAKLYKLSDEDRCLHSKGLHHGSVTGVFFLPTLKYCSNHYYASMHDNAVPAEKWVDWIQSEEINRLFLMSDLLDNFVNKLDLDKKTHDDVDIYVLAPLTDQHIKCLTEDFKYKIWSIFGCTETSGPLFLPSVRYDKDDPYLKYCMGHPLDDFYKLSVNSAGTLEVTMPNGSVICTGDRYKITDRGWIFQGREHLYKINNVPIYLDVLIECVENFTNSNHQDFFDLVVDSQENMIYIRTNEEIDLKKLNEIINSEIGPGFDSQNSYMIHKQIVGNRSNYFTGIKFDPEEIRLLCRQA